MRSSWDVPFASVDVEATPAARAELERFGIEHVPVVVAGERAMHGWNPRALAELVGVAYAEPGALPPAELARRLDRVLAAAQRAMRQVPARHLGMTWPGRDRPVRQLGYHLFRLSHAFPLAMAERRLPKAWLDETAPPDLADGATIAGYGETVRRDLAAWLARPDATDGSAGLSAGSTRRTGLRHRGVGSTPPGAPSGTAPRSPLDHPWLRAVGHGC